MPEWLPFDAAWTGRTVQNYAMLIPSVYFVSFCCLVWRLALAGRLWSISHWERWEREREREPSEKARRIHFQMQPNIAGLACPSLSYMARRRSPQPLRLAGRWRLAARMNKTTKLDSSVRFVVCCCQQIKRFHLSTPDDNRVKTGINLLTWREFRCYSSRDQEEENKHPHTDRHLLCLNR